MESSHQINGSIGKLIDKLDQKPGHETLTAVNGKLRGGKDGQRPTEVKAPEAKPAAAEDRRKGFLPVEQQDLRPGKRERPGKQFQPLKGAETASREAAGRKGSATDRPAVARQSQVHSLIKSHQDLPDFVALALETNQVLTSHNCSLFTSSLQSLSS